MEQDGTQPKKTIKVILSVFIISFLYAFIRYNVIRNVPYTEIPLYILNKSLALSSTLLIGLSYVLGPLTRFFPRQFTPHLPLRKHLGISGFAVAALHSFISLLLFNASYYPKFFEKTGKLNLLGNTSMLMGMLAFSIFALIVIYSHTTDAKSTNPAKWNLIQRLGYLAYFFVLLHVGIMGWSGWFRADSWLYGMASITLISSTFILLVLLLRLLAILFPLKTQK